MKLCVRNQKQTDAKRQDYATTSKQTKANHNIPKQMIANGDWKAAVEANVSKWTPITHNRNIHFKNQWRCNHNHNLRLRKRRNQSSTKPTSISKVNENLITTTIWECAICSLPSGAPHEKTPQIRLWPHCQTTDDANQRKSARTQRKKQTEENRHKQQQPVAKQMQKPRIQKNESKRKQIKQHVRNRHKKMPNDKKTRPYQNNKTKR